MMNSKTHAETVPRMTGPAVTRCANCGSREVTVALAPLDERERPIFLRCCRCGGERADLDFYEEF